MPTYLVVANQTLGGERLQQELRRRIEAGGAVFRVVVPLTEPQYYTTWSIEGMHHFEPAPDLTEAREQARTRSEEQLQELLRRIREHGGDAEGALGDADPMVAVESALEDQPFDEILVSTLPAGISRWLKLDLASRLERKVDVPVTVVEAEPRD